MDFKGQDALEASFGGAEFGPLGAALGLISKDDGTTGKMADAYQQGRQQMDDLTNGVELDQSDRDAVARTMNYGSY